MLDLENLEIHLNVYSLREPIKLWTSITAEYGLKLMPKLKTRIFAKITSQDINDRNITKKRKLKDSAKLVCKTKKITIHNISFFQKYNKNQ